MTDAIVAPSFSPPPNIDSDVVKAEFGDRATLDRLITEYRAAMAAHALTVDVPAPTTHPFVEIVVKYSGGLYNFIQIPEPEPWPDAGALFRAKQEEGGT